MYFLFFEILEESKFDVIYSPQSPGISSDFINWFILISEANNILTWNFAGEK